MAMGDVSHLLPDLNIVIFKSALAREVQSVYRRYVSHPLTQSSTVCVST